MIRILSLSAEKRAVKVTYVATSGEEEEESAKSVAVDTVLRFHFKAGLVLEEEEWEQALRFDTILSAKRYALKLLTRTSKSNRELLLKLQNRGYPAYACQAAVDAAKEYGYLSDDAFALNYARAHTGRGNRRIVAELKRRGVEDAAVEAAVEERDDEALCLQAARRYVSAREGALGLREKLVRHLSARGFSYSQIRRAIDVVEGERGCRLSQGEAEWSDD